MISVIIATLNRPNKLNHCLKSVLNNVFSDFEIIVVDQSINDRTKKIVYQFNFKKIKYFKINSKGKSKALNYAIRKSSGQILAFTDDDCIVDKNWLKNINRSLKQKDFSGAFGKTLPYRPKQNVGKICPCTFDKKDKKIISKPISHWNNVGFGNNMAFKKSIFKQIGDFKQWLGPGSIGSNAEDAEFALRALINKKIILFNPKIQVHHNRWITKEQFRKQSLSYSCGEVACYGYFAFQKKEFAKKVIRNNFKDSYYILRNSVKSFLLFRKNSSSLIYNSFEKTIYRLRGLLIGYYFSVKDPLFDGT